MANGPTAYGNVSSSAVLICICGREAVLLVVGAAKRSRAESAAIVHAAAPTGDACLASSCQCGRAVVLWLPREAGVTALQTTLNIVGVATCFVGWVFDRQAALPASLAAVKQASAQETFHECALAVRLQFCCVATLPSCID
jgi:hypothetical protein